MKPEDHWQKIATRARPAHPATSADKSAPLGFATRIVALAQPKPSTSLITRFRNYSLATAGTAALALAMMLALQEPKAQFIPIPELNLPSPSKP